MCLEKVLIYDLTESPINELRFDLKQMEDIMVELGFINPESNLDKIELLKLWEDVTNSDACIPFKLVKDILFDIMNYRSTFVPGAG